MLWLNSQDDEKATREVIGTCILTILGSEAKFGIVSQGTGLVVEWIYERL